MASASLPPRQPTLLRSFGLASQPPATSEASMAHGKPYTAADMLRGPARPRYSPPHPTTPAPQKIAPIIYCPSNSRHSPLFALNFPFNYYKTINKDNQSPSCCPGSASLPPRPADTSSKLWLGKPPLLRTRGLRLAPSGFGKPAPRRAAHPGTCDRGKEPGGFDESTPTQGPATATSPRRALRPAAVPAPGAIPASRYTLPHPPYHPTTSLFGPSNSRHSPLFAHDFSFNYYKTITKQSKRTISHGISESATPPSRRGSGAFMC